MFRLAKYCVREVIAASVLLGGLITALFVLTPLHVAYSLGGLLLAVWLWVLWFFRDPDRAVPAGHNLVICPADGRITDITPLGPEGSLGRPGTQIGIFMNVFSVHVNRSPIAGIVQRVEHKNGCFMDVRDPVAWYRNESATIYLERDSGGKRHVLVVRQIAGLVARRIVTDLSPGQVLAAGERIGMIKFGSRVEVLIPQELLGEVRVSIGQNVKAGLSILASLAEQ